METRLSESRGGLQNLVGPPQLAILALQVAQPSSFIAGQARSLAAVHLVAPQPQPRRLGADAQLPGDRGDRRPLGRVLRPVLPHQADGSLSELSRITGSSTHDSILSQSGVSTFPGAVQLAPARPSRASTNPIPRPPSQLRVASARARRASEGGAGAAGPEPDQPDDGHLQPPDAEHEAGCGQATRKLTRSSADRGTAVCIWLGQSLGQYISRDPPGATPGGSFLSGQRGDPGVTRTPDTQFRKLLLYPPELRGLSSSAWRCSLRVARPRNGPIIPEVKAG
jgi:hypothetical protein